MSRRSRHLIALAALSCAGAAVVVAFAGPIDPPAGPVAPTYKTLSQVEPRVDVATLPGNAFARHVIATPGSYYMSANVAGGPGLAGISIANDNITLDMRGFALTGVAGSTDGIVISGTRTNIIIRNGTIRSWGGDGIDAADETNVQLSGLNVSHNAGDGIVTGANAIVLSCAASSNTGDGFQLGEGSLIQDCTAALNAIGIFVPGTGTGGQPGTGGATIHACAAHRNTGNGIQGTHMTVTACTASFNAGSGFLITNSSLCDSEARGNTTHGFAGSASVYSRCKTRSNGQDGFNIGEGSIVESCVARGNNGDGIECDQRVTVRDCHVEANNIDGTGADAGIRLTNVDCRIEGNTLIGNSGGGVFCEATATGNVIIGNRATTNGSTNYSVIPGNFLGTVVATEAAMNAAVNSLVNISY